VFYSISNTQKGLAGISFGNFLIKQVVEEIKRELPNVQTFVTLSPAPGFASWLKRERAAEHSTVLDDAARATLDALDTPNWADDAATAEQVKAVLLPLAAHFSSTPRARAASRATRWRASTSATARGRAAELPRRPLRQGPAAVARVDGELPLRLDRIEENHEPMPRRGRIAASAAVRKLRPSRVAVVKAPAAGA